MSLPKHSILGGSNPFVSETLYILKTQNKKVNGVTFTSIVTDTNCNVLKSLKCLIRQGLRILSGL